MEKNGTGSVSIEATIALSFYIFSFIILISFSTIARVETITQNALDQTAKDISKYIYALETFVNMESGQEEFINDLVKYADFENSISSQTDGTNSESNMPTIPVNSITPSEIAEMITYELMEKYLVEATNEETLQSALESLGITGGIDLNDSTYLEDGQTVNLVAIYTIESPLPNFFDRDITVKQSAKTAAWIGDVSNTQGNVESIWDLPSMQRGQMLLDEFRASNPTTAVIPGIGVDFYDGQTMTFMFSMNIFDDSYGEGDYLSGTYVLNHEAISMQLEGYIVESIETTQNIGSEIEMMDGSIVNVTQPIYVEIQMVVPEEAANYATELNEISDALEMEYGVNVTWVYHEKAFVE